MSKDYEDDTPEELDPEAADAIESLIEEPLDEEDLEVEAQQELDNNDSPAAVYPPALDGPADEPNNGFTPMTPTGYI